MPRIKDFKVIRVTVPFTRPVKWAWGVRRSTTRHVVVLETDSGLTGYGETMGDYVITGIMQMIKPLMVGLHLGDPHFPRSCQKDPLLLRLPRLRLNRRFGNGHVGPVGEMLWASSI